MTFLTELDAGELDEEIENTVYCYEDYITINFDESQLPSGANGINDYSYQWYYFEQGEFQPINNSPNEPSFSTTLLSSNSGVQLSSSMEIIMFQSCVK